MKNKDKEGSMPGSVTKEDVRAYLESLKGKNLQEATRKLYEKKLWVFYRGLSPDKEISLESLQAWRKKLEKQYSPKTVNFYTAVVNGFLIWFGRRDLQFIDRLEEKTEQQPVITRNEYHRLLNVAVIQKDERAYFFVKLLATTGVSVQMLPRITVEAVRSGTIEELWNGVKQTIRIPPCLQKELLTYAAKQMIHSGRIFRTKKGGVVYRTYINKEIEKLCEHAHVAEEKATPRALKSCISMCRRI